MRVIVFDTETTDTLENGGKVIELAWQTVKFDDGQLVPEHPATSCRFGAETPISWGAMGVHHILPSDIAGYSKFTQEALPEASIYIGHDVSFDLQMCGKTETRSVCTLAMARRIWPNVSHTLSALTYMINEHMGNSLEITRDRLRNAHSAAADVEFCTELLSHMCEVQALMSMEELMTFAAECLIPTHMPFGKFKGCPVSEVDEGYRNWYKRQSDPDQYILQAFICYPYRNKL